MTPSKRTLILILGTVATLGMTPMAQAFEPVGTTSGFASRIDRAGFAERRAERRTERRAEKQRAERDAARNVEAERALKADSHPSSQQTRVEGKADPEGRD
ncbi:hypothetical protein [Erythrobacter litoralis]|uniref:Uncharacterized protein n=1 Tax=Erythrobacter litoralis (strain HTCC2594) TaxID=314225 RepID=Q2NAV2_ERYLH|nr:hypothetical protein [Erythrobacter litoralis]ABC63189.1 hypothetical protein ELI_05485 [Erythrobacter litoralis HTCC2594]